MRLQQQAGVSSVQISDSANIHALGRSYGTVPKKQSVLSQARPSQDLLHQCTQCFLYDFRKPDMVSLQLF